MLNKMMYIEQIGVYKHMDSYGVKSVPNFSPSSPSVSVSDLSSYSSLPESFSGPIYSSFSFGNGSLTGSSRVDIKSPEYFGTGECTYHAG